MYPDLTESHAALRPSLLGDAGRSSTPNLCPRLGRRRAGPFGRLIAAAGLLALGAIPSALAADQDQLAVAVSPAKAMALLPADHPKGTNAIVRLVQLDHALHVQEPTLSSFMIDFQPGGAAVLRHSPGSGFMVVHVLSGSIDAQAWHAGVGFYHAGQTWVQSAVASDVTAKNSSRTETARVLVVMLTGDARSPDAMTALPGAKP